MLVLSVSQVAISNLIFTANFDTVIATGAAFTRIGHRNDARQADKSDQDSDGEVIRDHVLVSCCDCSISFRLFYTI